MSSDLELKAKEWLDKKISTARVECYIPISIAEILYHGRTDGLDTSDPNWYTRDWKRWRNETTDELYGKSLTSSQEYQNAWIKKDAEAVLGLMRSLSHANGEGCVERYIYTRYKERLDNFENIASYPARVKNLDFSFDKFYASFATAQDCPPTGPLYEILVHALLSTSLEHIGASHMLEIRRTLDSLPQMLHRITDATLAEKKTGDSSAIDAIRLGVASAADAGVDVVLTNGVLVQVKHEQLDLSKLKAVVDRIQSGFVIVFAKGYTHNAIRWAEEAGKANLSTKQVCLFDHEQLRQAYLECLKDVGLLNSILNNLRRALDFEMPTRPALPQFLRRRGYITMAKKGIWVTARESY
jgi:hypothetical protein